MGLSERDEANALGWREEGDCGVGLSGRDEVNALGWREEGD